MKNLEKTVRKRLVKEEREREIFIVIKENLSLI
jgi:hypothetical protein